MKHYVSLQGVRGLSGLGLNSSLGWPAGPPEQISRLPNGSFGDPAEVNVLMSTSTVNPSAWIYLSPQIFVWPAGPLTQSFRRPSAEFSGHWHPGHR